MTQEHRDALLSELRDPHYSGMTEEQAYAALHDVPAVTEENPEPHSRIELNFRSVVSFPNRIDAAEFSSVFAEV